MRPAGGPARPSLVLLAVAVGGPGSVLHDVARSRPLPRPSNPPREQRKQAAALKESSGVQRSDGSLDVQAPGSCAAAARPRRKKRRDAIRSGSMCRPRRPRRRLRRQKRTGDKSYVAPPPPPPKVGDQELRSAADPAQVHLHGRGQGRKVAIFVNTDGQGHAAMHAAEGEIVLGQYRVVKIGVESVTMEYLDGRGRQTIPMRG